MSGGVSDLVERLRDDSWRTCRSLRKEAATALEAKEAEIAALKAELAKEKMTSRGDWASQRDNDHLTIEKYEWKARAETAERERDEARAALKAEQSRWSYHCD